MASKNLNEQVLGFLKKTGEDLKRVGEEVRVEAQRLLKEVQDPATQTRLKDNLRGLGSWAKKTAGEAGEMVDAAVRRAEATFQGAARRTTPTDTAEPSQTPEKTRDNEKAAPEPTEAAAPKRTAAKKTVGRKPGAKSRAPAAKGAGKKPLGRRKP